MEGGEQNRPKIKHRGLKKLFAFIVLLVALALLVYLFLIFRRAAFIPEVIDDILLGMCAAAALMSVWLFKKYIETLNGK